MCYHAQIMILGEKVDFSQFKVVGEKMLIVQKNGFFSWSTFGGYSNYLKFKKINFFTQNHNLGMITHKKIIANN